MVRGWLDHAAYQDWVRRELARFLAEHGGSIEPWASELHFAWHANLDAFVPILHRYYSTTGRPARDPAAMLRCLILMTFCHCKRITEWVRRLHREPVLAIACGFDPQDLPGIVTFYDFLRRLSPGVYRHHALRRRSAKRLLPKPGKKLPVARRSILDRLVRKLMLIPTPPKSGHGTVWNELLGQTVTASVDRGLIPRGNLTIAGDGTHLESGCHSHGHKTCECPKCKPCDHTRRYTDPGALNGWDSYRNHWLVGRSLYTLVETESGHDLPLWLTLGPSNRHDSLSGAMAVHHACLFYGATGLVIRRGVFDIAHEGAAFLRLCYHHRIDPVVARSKGAKPKRPTKKRLDKDGLSISSEGVPICSAGLHMRSRGHSKSHVWAWTCPQPGRCTDPCPFAKKALCLNALQDPRVCTPTPRATVARKELYKRRTAVERWHAWLDCAEVKNARHRRDYLWWGRVGLAAMVAHMKVWSGKVPRGWVNDVLLTEKAA